MPPLSVALEAAHKISLRHAYLLEEFGSSIRLPLLASLLWPVELDSQEELDSPPLLTSPHLTSPHLTSPHLTSSLLLAPAREP